MKKILYFFILVSQFTLSTWGMSFVVKNIELQGLKRTSQETLETYLPIKRGQTLKQNETARLVRTLYQTGFFEKISVSRKGSTLIIHVSEYPTIGQLKIIGNSVIPTDKLTDVMKKMDIAEARIYNPAMLEKITQALLNQYYQLGRYNAQVKVKVTSLPRHRVMVNIDISEGLVAKIRRITILGSHAFDEKTLLKQLNITTSGLFTFITQSDRYSETKLDENIEKLRGFYLDHGYLHFEVKSAQAEVTPDRKSVYVVIVVEEAQPYTISRYHLEGSLIFSQEAYAKLITIKPGETFSRAKIINTQKAISNFLGQRGYMYANISIRPEVNEAAHQVSIAFYIQPGKRTYIRQVTFSDNSRTNDTVLRREVVQMEAAPSSTVKLEESKHRLSLLPYIKDVSMSVNPVPGSKDQADVDYKVKESNSAEASFKIGYAASYGLTLGAGFNQKNFLGTGNTFGINLSRSRYEQLYGMEFTDPYYTEDGISRSLSFSISRIDPSAIANLENGYVTNEINFGVLYGIPIGQEVGAYNRVFAGANYQNILVTLDSNQAGRVSNQISSFINQHGRRYQELDLKLGYSRDSRDQAIFPNSGSLHTIFLDAYAPLASSSIAFYSLNYSGRWYQPITNSFILLSRADLGYANASSGVINYPFFKNFYAGGINSVRGYSAFTLGPRDSKGQAYGGTILTDASIGLILPNYISDNLRTTAFLDGGNVYSPLNNRIFGGKSSNAGPLRYSFGVEVDWITMLGPIQLSLAKPINPKRGRANNRNSVSDDEDIFQFALGANF